jgi:hypothetical protein
MKSIVPMLIASIFLASCSSQGDLVDGSEDYEGRHAAAVAPVADHRRGRGQHDDRLHAEIQRSIQRQLDQSGVFASVVALEQPDEGNEAEVIIEPTLVGAGGYGGDNLGLKVRVTEKTNRRTILDRTYEGGGGTSNALNVAVGELEDDLADRYD